MSNEIASLLRALISLTEHTVFDQGRLLEIIGKQSEKLLLAYDLCDGTNTQQEIARKVKLDPRNFRKAVGRWIEAGILFEWKVVTRLCSSTFIRFPMRAGKNGRQSQHNSKCSALLEDHVRRH